MTHTNDPETQAMLDRMAEKEQEGLSWTRNWTAEQLQQMAEQDARNREIDARELTKKKLALVAALELPPKDVALFAADGLKDTQALTVIRETTVPFIVLSGRPGCGKTTAASWWLWLYVMDSSNWSLGSGWQQFRTKPPIFTTAPRLARLDRYDDDAIQPLIRTPRLVVDDLGSEFLDAKGSFITTFGELVNERYNAARPTVFTTNIGPKDFAERYEARLMDRLCEVGRFARLSDPSLRRRP